MNKCCRSNRRSGWLAGCLLLLLTLAVPASLRAQIGMSATPDMNPADATIPDTVTVGDVGNSGRVTLSVDAAAGDSVNVTSVNLQPSCKISPIGTCGAGQEEAAESVFQFATGAAAGGGTCGATWTISAALADGSYNFSPDALVTIAPGGSCQVTFSYDVVGIPTTDASGIFAGIQTVQVGAVAGTGATSGLNASGTGQSITTVEFSCTVQVDKQVSCDGGTTWHDVGYADGAANGCIGNLGQNDILVRYRARNTGDVPVEACTINESNILLDGNADSPDNVAVGSLNVDQESSFFDASASALACNSDLTAGEPDTANLDCTCVTPLTDDPHATDSDQADFECCGAEVDKQVSCGGAPFVDTGFPNDGAESCTGLDGDDVVWQYQMQNISTGNVTVTCSLNDAGGANPSLFNIPSGGHAELLNAPPGVSDLIPGNTETCGEDFDNSEHPNTVTLNCTCAQPLLVDETDGVSDTDEADATCQTAAFDVSKTCVPDPEGGAGDFNVAVNITNNGDVNLNCNITDEYFTDVCPTPEGTPAGGVGTGTAVSLLPANPVSALAPPAPQPTSATGDISDLTETVCNQATVVCTPDGGTALPAQTATATCPVEGEGCFTRTPGFWKQHLFAAEAVMFGGDVISCGMDLTTTSAGLDGSTVEDLCINNGEASQKDDPFETSPQQVQLIRQCAAAALNLATSEQSELSCENATVGGAIPFDDIEERFGECCGVGLPADADFEKGVCNDDSSPSEIEASGCIGYLDAFNNASFNDGDGEDIIADLAGSDWNDTDTEQCQIADENQFLADEDENNGRDYGPRK